MEDPDNLLELKNLAVVINESLQKGIDMNRIP